MANTRARLLGPLPQDSQDDTVSSSPVYQIAGHRSGEGADSVLEQLRNDPSRKAPGLPDGGRPEMGVRDPDYNN